MNDLTPRLTFHDLRHCAINNLRPTGNDYFKIMAIAVQKTMKVFKRYNLVTEEELRSIVWQDQAEGSAPIDTYMDTKIYGSLLLSWLVFYQVQKEFF